MAVCPYNDPDVLSRYYEGVLDEEVEAAFSKHLLTCPKCLEALMNLERDLSLMSTVVLEQVPGRGRPALFRLLPQGLKLLYDPKPRRFTPLPLPAVRGERMVEQRIEREGVSVSLLPEPGETTARFRIRVQGVEGKLVQLQCLDRMLEQRSGTREGLVDIEGLEPGAYALYIDRNEFISFVVEEESG